MMEANLIHLLASDIRPTPKSKFHGKEAMTIIKKNYGSQMTYQLTDNAERLIEGEPLLSEPPEHIKKRKLISIF